MTDLERLHLVHESIGVFGSTPRRYGKTHYFCHCVAGYLEVLHNETIVVILHNLSRTDHWIPELKKVLLEHDIKIKRFDKSSFRLFFEDNTNNVKFMSFSSIAKMHPIDTGASHNQYPIIDFDNEPGWFFNKNYTIENIHTITISPSVEDHYERCKDRLNNRHYSKNIQRLFY